MRRLSWVLAGLLALVVASSANALSVSYYLDQSNDPEGWLPDGTNYAQVTIADNGSDIDVTVTLLSPLTSVAGANFGIADFLFNSTNVLSAADIVGEPGDWAVTTDYNPAAPYMTAGGFGRFEVKLSAGTRQDPTLSFTISIAGDSIGDYAVLSTNSSQGNTYFGLHVAGFLDQDTADPLDPIDIGNPGIGACYDTDGQGNYTAGCNILTSAWFGGTQVPEPATAWLLVPALGLLALRRARARA
jgi:hypothetical protein